MSTLLKVIALSAFFLSVTTATILAEQQPLTGAEDQITKAAQSARTSLLSAERVLFAAEQAIDAAAIIISSIDNERLVHIELGRLAKGVPGARAIIVVDREGTLLFDSYRYPASNLDLSERSYFREAIANSGIVVGQTVIGKTSGANFVPLAKRLGDTTIVVVASPFSLLDLQTECGDCWNMVLQSDGDVVTMFPPEAKLPRTLTEFVTQAPKPDGTSFVRYHNSVVAIAWRRSSHFPITLMSVRGVTDTAAPSVDLN